MEENQVEGKQSPLAREVAARKADRERKRAVFYPRLFKLIALGIVLLIAYDYWMFHSTQNEIKSAVSKLDGKMGSLMGWPFGIENVFSFQQELSDEQLDSLAVLDSKKYRNYVIIHFAFDMELTNLKDLRKRFPTCHVTCKNLDELRKLPEY